MNPVTGVASLPWVRLHALKDYYDMAALALAQPEFHVTFNLVPSLVDQLLDIAEGKTIDPAMRLAGRDAGSLSAEEQLGILDLFFSVPYRTRIAPFPRYAALYHKRGSKGPDRTYADAVGSFRAQDFRDLMVWFHLAWSGETLKKNPVIRELLRKAEGFTEEDKASLLKAQQEFLRGVIPQMRAAMKSGRIEISTSPYYHPILPLICDSDSALEAAPGLPLPHPTFKRPSDAVEQVRTAIQRHRAVFRKKPAGIWPSEGSLSEETIKIFSAEGVDWTASDEGILAAALLASGESPGWGGRPSHDQICRAWRLRGEGPALFFRERELSDLIGFTYSAWDGEGAADDLVRRLLAIRERLGAGCADAIVPIILDGENAWEYYPDQGVSFLTSLYRKLTSTPGLATTTFSGFLATSPEIRKLDHLRAGSWIRSDFTTWIGHREKNQGWDLLRMARDAFDRPARAPSDRDRQLAWTCLQAAEGSDWFWWYGDEHSSDEDPIFDASFRDLLKETYWLIGERPPEALSVPIMGRKRALYEPPTGVLAPTLDGKLTDYFEWLLAGVCEASSGFGTMRPGLAPIERVAFGWGPGHIYLRIDPLAVSAADLMHAGDLAVEFTRPQPARVLIHCRPGAAKPVIDPPEVRCAGDKVIEIAIPLALAGAKDGDVVAFAVSYRSGAASIERLPRDGEIELAAVEPDVWSV